MIVSIKKGTDESQIKNLVEWLESLNLEIHHSNGQYETILGLVGDTSHVDIDLIEGLNIVSRVARISEPYKKASRKFHPDDTMGKEMFNQILQKSYELKNVVVLPGYELELSSKLKK
jgi:3-deoxy-7-phosphoheptulonate synthase